MIESNITDIPEKYASNEEWYQEDPEGYIRALIEDINSTLKRLNLFQHNTLLFVLFWMVYLLFVDLQVNNLNQVLGIISVFFIFTGARLAYSNHKRIIKTLSLLESSKNLFLVESKKEYKPLNLKKQKIMNNYLNRSFNVKSWIQDRWYTIYMVFAIVFIVAISLTGCKKEPEQCKTCGIITNAPGASQSKSFCGTAEEISIEDARLKNECVDIQVQYPQYTFDCGCQ